MKNTNDIANPITTDIALFSQKFIILLYSKISIRKDEHLQCQNRLFPQHHIYNIRYYHQQM